MKNSKRTYVTKMPDKAGAFLEASRIISKKGGNIVRVNYNKSVDVHTLFLDVNATSLQHLGIARELSSVGYLSQGFSTQKVILIVLKLPDTVGAVTPVLEIINNYDINVTYISSQETGTPYQYFKMGLLVETPSTIARLLEDISQVCEVKIIDYDVTEKSLDNTVFYITFANAMRDILDLNQQQTNDVIINSNKIMQTLDERNERPIKTFEYIKQFAQFIVAQKSEAFDAQIDKVRLNDGITIFCIQPPCGSNTYILQKGLELLFVDCGFACYRDEMLAIFYNLIPDFYNCKKRVVITHTDVDHVGLVDLFDFSYMSNACYQNFLQEQQNMPNIREQNKLHEPYCQLSKIISDYQPPTLSKCKIIGTKKDDALFTPIGTVTFAGITLDAYEGCGGHIKGEIILVSDLHKIVFTGDILVNIEGFSAKQREFNLLAPYLMTSVNADSKKAKELRQYILDNYAEYTLYPGHGSPVKLKEKVSP